MAHTSLHERRSNCSQTSFVTEVVRRNLQLSISNFTSCVLLQTFICKELDSCQYFRTGSSSFS